VFVIKYKYDKTNSYTCTCIYDIYLINEVKVTLDQRFLILTRQKQSSQKPPG